MLISILIIGLFVINTLYWIYISWRFSRIELRSPDQNTSASVTVVIIARNEEQNLKKHLLSWLEQDYPAHGVMVVDDGSTDQSVEWLRSMKSRYQNLEILPLSKSGAGKKAALRRAIEEVRSEWMLLTDADCRPEGDQWIKEMIGHAKQHHSVVLGYGPLYKRPNFTNRLSRFETILTAIQYYTWADHGFPYMGVGRNLAYRTSVARNYDFDPDLASGDDDLFIQQFADDNTTALSLSPGSFAYSESKTNWFSWLDQKSRHVTTSYHYPPMVKVGLGLFGLSQIVWPLIFIFPWALILPLVFLRWLILALIGGKAFSRLKGEDLIKWIPILDIALSVNYIIILPLSLFRNKSRW